jgi:hypothetical protein
LNLKEAKRLRKKARTYMNKYVEEYVLTTEEAAKKNYNKLYKSLPRKMHVAHAGTTKNGVLTQRWWYRMVKNNPDWSYTWMVGIAYGKF